MFYNNVAVPLTQDIGKFCFDETLLFGKVQNESLYLKD